MRVRAKAVRAPTLVIPQDFNEPSSSLHTFMQEWGEHEPDAQLED